MVRHYKCDDIHLDTRNVSSILLTCKQIYREAASVPFTANTFSFYEPGHNPGATARNTAMAAGRYRFRTTYYPLPTAGGAGPIVPPPPNY